MLHCANGETQAMTGSRSSDGGPAGLIPPSVTFRGERFDADALADIAASWAEAAAARLPAAPDAVAVVTPSHPMTVALLFALSTLPHPVVLLHPEPATWRSAPPFPERMPVFLAPGDERFA